LIGSCDFPIETGCSGTWLLVAEINTLLLGIYKVVVGKCQEEDEVSRGRIDHKDPRFYPHTTGHGPWSQLDLLVGRGEAPGGSQVLIPQIKKFRNMSSLMSLVRVINSAKFDQNQATVSHWINLETCPSASSYTEGQKRL